MRKRDTETKRERYKERERRREKRKRKRERNLSRVLLWRSEELIYKVCIKHGRFW